MFHVKHIHRRAHALDCDFLVIGSGIAGLSFALRIAEHGDVVVVTKKQAADSATNLAQGGIAAVLSPQDSVESHVEDTLAAGDFLCDYDTVCDVVAAGKQRVEDLMRLGVEFARSEEDGYLSLGKEGGHTHRRVAHSFDLTGKAIEQALLSKVQIHHNISVLEDHMAVDLLMTEEGGFDRCFGAYIVKVNQEVITVTARRMTILSTGGAGKVYLYTSNPDIATGDGIAMAHRAGARIGNMEFVQFHPTCLYHPQAKNFLISEAVRGEGAHLINSNGLRFMEKYDGRGELSTRDRVALSIDQELKESGEDCVYLDISHKKSSFVRERFPTIYQMCKNYGIDITKEPIPVVPAAHYLCGGVMVDRWGNSSVAGLMALGETSCTGLHGANRLASNSLLEAVVYAERAAKYCMDLNFKQNEVNVVPDDWTVGSAQPLTEAILINHNWDAIRRTMWNYVGIVRSVKRLQLARRRLKVIAADIEELYRNYHINQNLVEVRNIAHVAQLIVGAAILRTESRGLHFCIDYPDKDKEQELWNITMRSPGRAPGEFDVETVSFSRK